MGFRFHGGSGGGGVTLGPAQNTFGTTSTASKAAAETLRNTYAGANAAWLAQYNGDRSFMIRLVWTNNAQAYQRRNAAGTAWEDVTRVAPGTKGDRGDVGPGVPDGGAVMDLLFKTGAGNQATGWRRLLDMDIPSSIARDSEVVTQIQNAIQNHLANAGHLTPQQAADIANSFVDARVAGSGASRQLLLFRASGAGHLAVDLPENTATGGDGVSLADALAAIVAGDGIDIDRTSPGLIRISAHGGAASSGPLPMAALGQPNLAHTDITESGVLDSDGATVGRFAYSVVDGAADSGEHNIRWDPAATAHSLPDGASYDSATGILTLPAGIWIIEAVMSLIVMRSATQAANDNTIADIQARLYEGGQLRYSEGVFFWGQVNNHPTLSVTGSLVIPEGRTDTVQVRLVSTPGGSTNPTLQTVVENAHMEAIRIGNSGDAPPLQEQHIRAGWSADTSIADAELSATSPTNTVRLGTNASGLNYLALWRSDADGGNPTEVHISGGGNARNTFGAATDRTIGGVPGKLIVSATRQNADLLGGELVRLV